MLLPLAAALFFAGVADTQGQRRLEPRPIPYSELDKTEAEQTLNELREFTLPGVCHFQFHLRVMPRRGRESLFQGRMWAGRSEDGPVFRYEIEDQRGGEGGVLRLLVQNGPNAAVWVLDGDGETASPRRLGAEELFQPLRGTDFTPFDLQMPFLFWDDYAYEGLQRVRGRSSHAFLMYPPAEVAEALPDLGGVRVFVDAAFRVLTGAKLVDGRGNAVKGFNIIEVKKVEDDWMVKSVDVRDTASGNRTRLAIRAGAVRLDPESHPFTPEALGDDFPEVEPDKLRFF